MLLIAGIVPDNEYPLTVGKVTQAEDGRSLLTDGRRIPCAQGTAAMLSTALAVTKYLGLEAPYAVLAGDTGSGTGTRQIYNYLIKNITKLSPQVLSLHYCLPILTLMQQLHLAVREVPQKPLLIADAGSMYAAKASGLAPQFDLFTPDASELAFLADPEAIHPAYISNYLFEGDITKAPEFIQQAYRINGAAKVMLVKGSVDYIAAHGQVLEKVDEPNVPELECMGGTGDTITGMVSAFIYAGFALEQAAIISAKANRTAGLVTKVTPASHVGELIQQLPRVLKENLCSWSGLCTR
ncbi:MAG: NAD(P)H-hydrate dehydratase [Clostridia bacterium]|jgi:NAD(P)H-hydrate repair Nnr-like enzyme with NAD(P)H-hydrate dehydratase domain|nr:NAD(P)H-hydrate dehydratase [Clostridia bacterium]